MPRSLCCVSLTECTCCVCLCCAVARSLVQQCVTVLFARGATEQSRHLSLSGSALPFPKGVTLIDPAARTVTVPRLGSHEHEVPSLSLSLESFVCRSHRGRVSSVRVRPCASESLSVSCLSTGASQSLFSLAACPQALVLKKCFVCNRGTLGVYAARPRARLPVHSLSTALPIAHTLSPDVHIGSLPTPLK